MNMIDKIVDFIDPRDGMLKESDYPEDMGRNDSYSLKSEINQLLNVYLTQMKLYSKDMTVYGLWLFVLAIPVITFTDMLDGLVFERYLADLGETGETYAALCLSLLSLMIALISSLICGSIIPNEFRSRTAYLHLPFPQSRETFYFGKFAAGLTVVLSLIIAAFAMAVFSATWKYTNISDTAMLQSATVAIAGTFALCATAYGVSSFLNRSSTMLPFIIIFMVIPMIGLLLSGYDQLSGIICYIPCFSGDVAVGCLGSGYSVSTSYLFSETEVLFSCKPILSVAASLLWGVLFLMLGYYRIRRREM